MKRCWRHDWQDWYDVPVHGTIMACRHCGIMGRYLATNEAPRQDEWLAELSYMTDALRIPLFQKDNLAATLAPRSLRQEWPQWMMEETGGVAARGRLSSGLQ